MRLLGKTMLAGVAALTAAGGVMAAEQTVRIVPIHILNVRLPDGSVRQIRYVGDKPPRVIFVPEARQVVRIDPRFAAMDRMFAQMHAQSDAMMRQAAALQRQAAAANASVNQTALKSGAAPAPAGVVRYSYVSTTRSNGTCTQRVQMTSFGANQPPKVISQTSGDCSKVNQPVMTTAAPAPVRPAPKPVAPRPVKPAANPRDTI